MRVTSRFDYTVPFRRQISHYNMQKIKFISSKIYNIFIYNVSDLILLGEKNNSNFFLTNLPKLSTIKKYTNHFLFRLLYKICETN